MHPGLGRKGCRRADGDKASIVYSRLVLNRLLFFAVSNRGKRNKHFSRCDDLSQVGQLDFASKEVVHLFPVPPSGWIEHRPAQSYITGLPAQRPS
jgi:hypothetical protein